MYSSNNTIPTVAIVGKPNVGKSSLFNRLIRRQKAITSDEPGITRDINYEIVTNNKISYRLADSAGFKSSKETIAHLTNNRNRRLIEEATIVLFICEIGELSIEDFELAKIIRRSGKPCILIINKVDNEKLEEAIYDFFDLGIEEPLPISVLQGKNLGTLRDVIAEKIENYYKNSTTVENDSKDNFKNKDSIIKIAIVGKPNVGKSSLLNLLVNSERSLVTPHPGTTRDAIDATILYNGYKIQLIDTAGIKKRGKIKENIEYYSLVRTERAVKGSIISILLIDAETGITTQDKKIASLIVSEKKGLIIAANKWDRAENMGINPKEFIKDIYYYFPHISFADVVTISAKTGYNKIKLLKKMLTVYNNYNLKIKTRDLNSLIRNIDLHGTHIKYGIQKSTAPPVFEFFISKSREKNRNFRQFISNSIRRELDLKGVPIEVNLRIK